MDLTEPTLKRFHLDKLNRWQTAAILGWSITLVVIALRFLLKPGRTLGFSPYWRAANDWFLSKNLYIYVANKGFVYSPFAAVSLTPLTIFPSPVANALWRVLGAACMLMGLWCVMKVGPFASIPARLRGLVYLLVLPLSLSNLDTGQSNAMVIGLLLMGLAAAYTDRWTLAAIAIAVATHWKIYPIAVGMLIMLLAPWKFGWRFVLALVVLALVPFLFQKPYYVISQYQLWVDTRMADNRLVYKIQDAPLDFWFVAVRMAALPLSQTAYKLLQLGAAGGIALFCVYGRWRGWAKERIYGGLFCLVCGWMLLFGPASEWLTYLLLAPAVALSLVDNCNRPLDTATRVMVGLSYGLLLLAALRVAFIPHWHDDNALLLSLQPFGAACFIIFALLRYGRDWPVSADDSGIAESLEQVNVPDGKGR